MISATRRSPPLGLSGCPSCGLVQRCPPVVESQRACCARCGHPLLDPEARRKSRVRAASAALAALILYPLAMVLPIMSLERFGWTQEASIGSGALGMIAHGEWVVGWIVFLCSVVLPLGKIMAILGLTFTAHRWSTVARRRTWWALELAGRWGMLDVLLVSVVVAWVKLGDLVEVRPGPGAVAFTACVTCSLLASVWFDPHTLWDEPSGASDAKTP